jgi:hypothetical protein
VLLAHRRFKNLNESVLNEPHSKFCSIALVQLSHAFDVFEDLEAIVALSANGKE